MFIVGKSRGRMMCENKCLILIITILYKASFTKVSKCCTRASTNKHKLNNRLGIKLNEFVPWL